MKYLLSFIIVAFLFSCASNTIIDPKTNKRVKVFENQDYQFYYPPNWEFYDFKSEFELDGILRLAHKKTIFDAFTYQDSVSGKSKNVVGDKSDKNSFESHKGKIINSTDSKFSSSSVSIFKFQKNSDNTKKCFSYFHIDEDFKKGNKEGVSRVSDNFYIIKSRIEGRTRENDFRYATRVTKKYVYITEDFYYIVDYLASEFLYTKYLKDAEVVLKSFKLK